MKSITKSKGLTPQQEAEVVLKELKELLAKAPSGTREEGNLSFKIMKQRLFLETFEPEEITH
jgi:hypothetical protein